jgi:hypothetical protein
VRAPNRVRNILSIYIFVLNTIITRDILTRRRNGILLRGDSVANLRKLTTLEELVIIKYILNLDL